MCGIIGIASNKPVSINIINSLKKLEYRGYDSAGLATLTNKNINEKKCIGRVEELEKILFKTPRDGNIGIGHVRCGLLMAFPILLMLIRILQIRYPWFITV